MRGAIVFSIAFVIFLAVTFFTYPQLPPGYNISTAINVDENVTWSGFKIIELTSAIFNGIIYGVIIWLIFSLIEKARGKGETRGAVKDAVKDEVKDEEKKIEST